jgi:hypothetical protein
MGHVSNPQKRDLADLINTFERANHKFSEFMKFSGLSQVAGLTSVRFQPLSFGQVILRSEDRINAFGHCGLAVWIRTMDFSTKYEQFPDDQFLLEDFWWNNPFFKV